jgi:hypothetical protein
VYGFVRSSPINFLDALGLWIIERNGDAKAYATAEAGDSVSTLAPLIGLDPDDFDDWLTSEEEPMPRTTTEVLCGRHQIPNTVVAYWAGDVGAIGRAWVFRGRRVRELRRRGFLVEDMRFRPNWRIEWTRPDGEGDTPDYEWVPVTGGSPRGELQGKLESLASTRVLHGLYFWGHGWPGGAGANDGEGFSVQVYYGDINLAYKMGLGWVHACYSNYGKSSLVSGTPGHEWIGYDAVLSPVLPGVEIDWPWGPYPRYDEGE